MRSATLFAQAGFITGDRVRITAQLSRADNGFHLWSQTYDRTLDGHRWKGRPVQGMVEKPGIKDPFCYFSAGSMPFKNLNRSLSVESTSVVFSAMMLL